MKRALVTASFTLAVVSAPPILGAENTCYPWQKRFGEPTRAAVDLQAQLCTAMEQQTTQQGDVSRTVMRSGKVTTDASATALIFNNALEVATWEGKFELPEEGDAVVNGALYAFGQQVVDETVVLAFNLKHQFELLDYHQKFPHTFLVGAVPATVMVGVRSHVTTEVEAGIRREALTAAARPWATADLYAEAGIGPEVVFVGIEGAAKIVDEKMDMGTALTARPNEDGTFTVEGRAKGAHQMTALTGSIDGIARIGQRTQRVGIISLPGYSQEGILFDDVFTRVVDPR